MKNLYQEDNKTVVNELTLAFITRELEFHPFESCMLHVFDVIINRDKNDQDLYSRIEICNQNY